MGGSCGRVPKGLLSAYAVYVYMSLCLKRAGAMVAAAMPTEAHCWAHLRLYIPCTDLQGPSYLLVQTLVVTGLWPPSEFGFFSFQDKSNNLGKGNRK